VDPERRQPKDTRASSIIFPCHDKITEIYATITLPTLASNRQNTGEPNMKRQQRFAVLTNFSSMGQKKGDKTLVKREQRTGKKVDRRQRKRGIGKWDWKLG
jgi:hypothetical protein